MKKINFSRKLIAKYLVLMLVIAVLAVETPASVKANQWENTIYVINCKESITLRQIPSTSGKEICQIPLDSAITYNGVADNGFYYVTYKGKNGYVLASYCSLPAELMEDYECEGGDPYCNGDYRDPYDNGDNGYRVTKCDSFITLRESDNTSAKEICKIDLGDWVYYIADARNDFVQVSYNGQVGYVLENYLTYMGWGEGDMSLIQMKVANCKEFVTLRSTPNTSASALCTIPLGGKVFFLGKAENGFYYVYYNDQYGYVLSQYLKNITK